MDKKQLDILNVSININQSLDVVWDTWNDENQMKYWMFISDDYEVKNPHNDLRIGGGYSYRMVSKNGGFDFNYSGTYTQIDLMKFIAFTLQDGRQAEVVFSVIEDVVHIDMHFETVQEQDFDVQLQGWQALLIHFKNHVESSFGLAQ
jgi:uncharacterized protein YndB with AHSA1/START domain